MSSNLLRLLPSVRGEYRESSSLAKNSWFNVGGNAEILYKPADAEDLSYFLANRPHNIQITILGACSNVIIRDHMVDGVVIKLGRAFTDINIEGDIVKVGCAALDYNVALFLLEKELSGLEFLIGVPGLIGGAIAMNAGCYNQEISDCLLEVEAAHKDTGEKVILDKNQLNLSYRTNKKASDYIFTKAIFKLKKGSKNEMRSKMEMISKQRESSQPIRFKTGGSTFKNPKNSEYKAWQLIERAGMRGYRIGDAQMSEKHCNFMLNLGNATAKDLESLGELVRDKVYKDSGIMLQWEIKRIGR